MEFLFIVFLFFFSLACLLWIVQGISLAIDWFINYFTSDE